MFILLVRVKLPDGTISKCPLVLNTKDGEKVASFHTFDKAIEFVAHCLPGLPDIEEIIN